MPRFDIQTGQAFASDGGFAKTIGKYGLSAGFDGSSTGITRAITSYAPTALSFFAIAQTTTTSGTRNICSIGTGGNYTAQLRQDGANWSFYLSTVGDILAGETSGVTANAYSIVCATWDGFTQTLYRDGALRSSTSNANAIPGVRYPDTWKIGEDNFGAKQAWLGDIPLVAFWPFRALASAEVLLLMANPWQLFAPPPRRIFGSGAAPIYQRALCLLP